MDASPETLNYALPSRRRRRLLIVTLVLSALAVGIVGKLCWDKFAVPMRQRMTMARLQERYAHYPWPRSTFSTGERLSIATEKVEDKAGRMLLQAIEGSRTTGSTLFYGSIGKADARRYVYISLNKTIGQPVSSLTMLVRVHSVATLFHAAEPTREVQIIPFITFNAKFSIDAPLRSATNPRLLVLTGTRDEAPFRYEMFIDGDDKVHIVEDKTFATTRPIRNK